jgi:hypothetical protein
VKYSFSIKYLSNIIKDEYTLSDNALKAMTLQVLTMEELHSLRNRYLVAGLNCQNVYVALSTYYV